MKFHKMQGAANDFVVIDGRELTGIDWRALAIRACDRRVGIGGDGILVLEHSATEDFGLRYHNADGSLGEMCGNGIRCMAKFAIDIGATEKLLLAWETGAGRVTTEVLEHGEGRTVVRADMGPPRFAPADIPVEATGDAVRGVAFSV